MFVVCVLQRGQEAGAGFAEEFVRSGVEASSREDIGVVLTEVQAVRHSECRGERICLRHGERRGDTLRSDFIRDVVVRSRIDSRLLDVRRFHRDVGFG